MGTARLVLLCLHHEGTREVMLPAGGKKQALPRLVKVACSRDCWGRKPHEAELVKMLSKNLRSSIQGTGNLFVLSVLSSPALSG